MIRKTKASALELPTMTALEKSLTLKDNLGFIQKKAEQALQVSSPADIRSLLDEAVEMARKKKTPNVLLSAAKILSGMHEAGIGLAMEALSLENKLCSGVPDSMMNVQINNNVHQERALPSVEEAKSAINRYVDILGVGSKPSGDGSGPDEGARNLDRKLPEDISGTEAGNGRGSVGRGTGSDESEDHPLPAERKPTDPVPEDEILSGDEETDPVADSESPETGDNNPNPSLIL
ncbi:MAG: hypothetical protein CL793_07380 [Chloroflexi bacterium]|nr:hypothetical protein [Chloroflexota bacterium]MBG95058.1 hypothetical protein [Chloroflexota bacterium]|tara:strand:- start:7449 stop:8150 length:702 start_codon:yes stop_codon:yes gene_type:complete